ncbi:zinc ribbon domain-containing protein [Halomicrococcus sp. NG-SE-24]|uniref:zinc ribbon domain-containing protein n=1 Tax=Halomicrococcus sp. NG-SE-24 TaxID=3436928 RepID=UPI003D982FDA
MRIEAEQVVALAVWLVVAAFLAVLFYMGPVGWVVGVLVFLGALKFTDLSDVFDGEPQREKVNCPACGARNRVDDPTCEYCGHRLAASGE